MSLVMWALRLKASFYFHLLPFFSLCFVFEVKDVISKLPAPSALPVAGCLALR